MGNAHTSSSACEQNGSEPDLWWSNSSETQTKPTVSEEIAAIRQRRVEVIEAKKKEMEDLRRENEELKALLRQRNEGFAAPRVGVSDQNDIGDKEKLREQVNELQKHLEKANAVFEGERQEYKKHVVALKDVIAVSKQLLLIREDENKQLTSKVAEIQATLSEKELEMFSNDIREEYERQLKNMKQLKSLYEEKQRADKAECDRLKSQLDDATLQLKMEETKNKELEERVNELEQSNSEKYDSVRSLESQLGLSKAECAELRAEMAVINQLFSQILLGFNNGPEVDLDNLIKLLEENHDLLTDIVVNEECSVMSSALPKVLLDLVHQVNKKDQAEVVDEAEPQNPSQHNTISSAAEIVENLPKVWRVLIELLSHRATFKNENNEECDKNPCYKSVETPTGTTLVLSVSKTFIRLKDLIVEKKSLEKETTRLKQLNTHLEVRLQDQEKRLEEVSQELANTWHVVGKMQKQHQQLHTHEKILRYELSQKRKLLNGLKEELEYCKEKCLLAHEKNSSTEEQWKQLRSEFAARRAIILNDDVNNSMESGYSDDRESSSDDDYDESASPTILGVIKDEIVNIECSTGTDKTLIEDDSEVVSSNLDKHCDINNTYKKLECDILETIKQAHEEKEAGTSGAQSSSITSTIKTPEEILAGREERLQRLEEQAQQLVRKVLKNANRGTEFCEKLNDLHDKYGNSKDCTHEGADKDGSTS